MGVVSFHFRACLVDVGKWRSFSRMMFFFLIEGLTCLHELLLPKKED